MLEDMCISEVDMKFYENRTRLKGELKEFESIRCKNRTHINQFITIATPHRGSPKALQLWEK